MLLDLAKCKIHGECKAIFRKQSLTFKKNKEKAEKQVQRETGGDTFCCR